MAIKAKLAALILLCSAATARAESSGDRYQAGLQAFAAGDYEKAAAELTSALVHHPNAKAALYLGNAHLKLGHLGRARDALKLALQLDPNGPKRQAIEELIAVIEARQRPPRDKTAGITTPTKPRSRRTVEDKARPAPPSSPAPTPVATADTPARTPASTPTDVPATATETASATETATRTETATKTETGPVPAPVPAPAPVSSPIAETDAPAKTAAPTASTQTPASSENAAPLLSTPAPGTPRRTGFPNLGLYAGLMGGGNFVVRAWNLGSHTSLSNDGSDGGGHPGSFGLAGARIGIQVIPRLAIEAEFYWVGLPSALDTSHGMAYNLNVVVHLLRGRWTPIVEGGVGMYQVVAGKLGPDVDPRVHVGIGVRGLVRPWLSLRVELRDVISDGFDHFGSNSLELLAGLDFYLWERWK